MKSRFTLLVAALMITSGAFAQNSDLTAEKYEIAKVFDRYSEAWLTEDIGKFASLFTHRDDLVIFDGSATYMGWVAWQTKLVNSFPDAEDVKVSFRDHDIQIHSSGEVAYLTAFEDVDYMENGKLFSFDGMRVTWVLAREDGKWVIIHGHWSVPIQN